MPETAGLIQWMDEIRDRRDTSARMPTDNCKNHLKDPAGLFIGSFMAIRKDGILKRAYAGRCL